MRKQIKIMVDADACPVKQEIAQLGEEFDILVTFVASYAHYSTEHGSNWIYVDAEKEAADIYIANHISKGDIVITQDMGLASILTHKGVYVMTARGKVLKEEDMPAILHRRYLSYKQMSSGNRVKGPKAFTEQDRAMFYDILKKRLLSL